MATYVSIPLMPRFDGIAGSGELRQVHPVPAGLPLPRRAGGETIQGAPAPAPPCTHTHTSHTLKPKLPRQDMSKPARNTVDASNSLPLAPDPHLQFTHPCTPHPPTRTRKVWFLDASKQCFGAGTAHLANLFIAIYLARAGASDEVRQTRCAPSCLSWLGGSFCLIRC